MDTETIDKEPHLKNFQYYADLYDRHTVEMCRRTERSFGNVDVSLPKKTSKAQGDRIKDFAKQWYLRMETGERYLKRSETIREWVDRDKHRDELLASAQPPEGIRCLTCRNLVKPTFKELFSQLEGKPDRILFMFDCPNKCVPRRAFFSDGEEWRVKPDLCPQCGTVLDKKMTDDDKKLVTTYTCPKCKYKNADEYVWTKKDEEYDEKFAEDRDRFCMTEEEGQKYYSEKTSWQQLGKLMEEFKKEDNARKEKLKENPKGFIIDGRRGCAICFSGDGAEGNWYDQYGIKCLTCQWAIDHGEIPASLAEEKDNFYSKYDLEHNFNLKGPVLRRWIKEGIIKVRNVSRYGKGVHVELFLMEDNKGFLPPKKMLKSHSVQEVKDGQTWTHMEPWYRFVDPFKHLKKYGIIKHMRIVPPEEMKAREEEEKQKWEERRARREARKKYPMRHKHKTR